MGDRPWCGRELRPRTPRNVRRRVAVRTGLPPDFGSTRREMSFSRRYDARMPVWQQLAPGQAIHQRLAWMN
jgi:hypothetical protein